MFFFVRTREGPGKLWHDTVLHQAVVRCHRVRLAICLAFRRTGFRSICLRGFLVSRVLLRLGELGEFVPRQPRQGFSYLASRIVLTRSAISLCVPVLLHGTRSVPCSPNLGFQSTVSNLAGTSIYCTDCL